MSDKMKIILIASGGALVLLIILIIVLKQRRRSREMKRHAEDRLREEALDRVLTGKGRGLNDAGNAVPFDVKYDLDKRGKKEQNSRVGVPDGTVMLQLTERSELSTRKYMFHVINSIRFGRSTRNEVVINLPTIADFQCEIFRIKKTLYVKNTGAPGVVFLRRKKRRLMVDSEAVQLENGDQIQIGEYSYELLML